MKQLIKEVRTIWEFEGGAGFEQFVRWDGTRTSFDEIKKSMANTKNLALKGFKRLLILDDDVEISIPVEEIPHILSNRTGVLVIFEEKPTKLSCSIAPWFFECPNNAAIYNADGSLRFQLQSPYGIGSYIGAVHHSASQNYPESLGVLVGSLGHQPEWLCSIDPNSPKLIPTGKWVRY
ncbi:hypothetical protein [Pseudomonas monsensis]|uniref:hypothetical protein n=1 Tax=Pseudomonas monsensis TaxID=2745509 RepID=UPI003D1E6483